MLDTQAAKRVAYGALAAFGAATAGYAAIAGAAWLRFGHARPPENGDGDALLDLFMPDYDVVERHHISVDAPAEATFAASMCVSFDDSPIIRAIFKGRELILGAEPDMRFQSKSVVEVTKALGWVVLAEVPGHELVMGAVTKPWEPNVVFRGVPSEQFAAFAEPGYVKIVWTLRADAVGPNASIAQTETRAVATDGEARRKFRWYWARFSPGIAVIREMAQRLVKQEAAGRWRPSCHRPGARLSESCLRAPQ
jgi:hypothetical protein